MRQLAYVLPALALMLGACTATPDEPIDDVPDADGKADAATFPYGAFEYNGATGDQLSELILLPDHSYIRLASLEHDSIRTRGTFMFTRYEDRKYIRFYDTDGTFVDRYRYYVNGSVLKVRPNPTASSTGAYQPLFTAGKDKQAWTRAIELDWFDNWFDIDIDTWTQSANRIGANELPAAAMQAYTELTQFGAIDVDLYTFTSHGGSGFIAYAFDTVMFFDASGAVLATGANSDDFFEFEWQ